MSSHPNSQPQGVGARWFIPGGPRSKRRLYRVGLSATSLLLILIVGAWFALRLVPLPTGLLKPSDGAESMGEFLDQNGLPLRQMTDARSYYSRPAPYGDIPQRLIDATLAAEDKRFWRHHGIDWRSTARAALGLLRQHRVVSGASTITQQLIKIAQPRPRTLRTKFIEAAQALRLEQVWSKQRILGEYLNRLDYGNLRSGCGAAAEYYFQKPLVDLSIAEAAFLAGLPQAPTRLNPRLHFDRASKRQQWILQRMVHEHILTDEAWRRAAEEPLHLAPPARVFQAPHFVDLLLEDLAQRGVRAGSPTSQRTTLDLPLNQFAEQALREHLAKLGARHPINGAVVVIENSTGNVLALVGSENYFEPGAGQVNGATAPRSPGSTLKPFTYLLAFEHGATPATVVADVPSEFPTASGIFRPVNYNHRCYGPMRYRLALANSLNISAVNVLASLNGPSVLQAGLQACGLTTLTQKPEFYGLGLTIGNAEARLLELANAYACLARLGTFKPYRLLQPDRRDLRDREAGRRVFDSSAAYLVADILSDNSARTLAFGVDSDLRFDFPVACKTGTSSDFRDNWALGFTPEFTVGVWVGNFDGTPMEHISGVTGAAPIFHDLFVRLHETVGTTWYEPPTNVVTRWIHPISGKVLAQARPGAVLEHFIAGTLPPEEQPGDFNQSGRLHLPVRYREWFAGADNWLGERAVLDAESPGLSLVSPQPGATYYLDPDLPAASRRLPLKAESSSPILWESETLRCQTEGGRDFAVLSEGEHRLTVRNPKTGTAIETWIVVKPL